jgi:hypothetical protein
MDLRRELLLIGLPTELEEPRIKSISDRGGMLGLAEIREFQAIVREECGVELEAVEAWNRANELLALYRVLLGPIPEDPARFEDRSGSNVVPFGSSSPGTVT